MSDNIQISNDLGFQGLTSRLCVFLDLGVQRRKKGAGASFEGGWGAVAPRKKKKRKILRLLGSLSGKKGGWLTWRPGNTRVLCIYGRWVGA